MRTFSRLALAATAIAALVSPSAHAADLAPMQIVEDPAADHPTTVAAALGADWMGDTVTPVGAASDLVGVSIAETADAVDVIWKVSDINEYVYPAAPLPVSYYFEFTLASGGVSAQFSLRARLNPVPVSTANPGNGVNNNYPAAFLQSNCRTENNLITCTTIPGSVVTLTVDTAAETITARLRRQDLKGPNGVELGVDGARLAEDRLFRGIAACTSQVMVIMAAGCDEGDMSGVGVYTLGQARPV